TAVRSRSGPGTKPREAASRAPAASACRIDAFSYANRKAASPENAMDGLFRQDRVEDRLGGRQRVLGSRRGAFAHGRFGHLGTQIERARERNLRGRGWAIRVDGLGIRRPWL